MIVSDVTLRTNRRHRSLPILVIISFPLSLRGPEEWRIVSKIVYRRYSDHQIKIVILIKSERVILVWRCLGLVNPKAKGRVNRSDLTSWVHLSPANRTLIGSIIMVYARIRVMEVALSLSPQCYPKIIKRSSKIMLFTNRRARPCLKSRRKSWLKLMIK